MTEEERASSADERSSEREIVATGANDAAGEVEQQTIPPLEESSDNSACSRPDGALVTATSDRDASVAKASEPRVTAVTASPVVEEEAPAAATTPPTTPTMLAASSKVSTSTAAKADDRNSAASSSTTLPASVPGKALEQQAEVPEQQVAAVSNGKVMEDKLDEEAAEAAAPGAGSPAEASSPSDGLRKALVGFYIVHNPGRIATLDVILKQYVGKEELLIERLEQKYTADLSHARKVAAAAAVAARAAGQIPHPLSPSQPSDRAAPPVAGETLVQRGGGGVPVLSRPPSSAFTSGHNNNNNNTPPRSGGAASQPSGAGYGNGTSSSNYMTYLADQIRSNVEGFLPASSSGGGGGGGPAGGGTASYPVSYVPFSPTTTTTGAGRPPAAAGFERAASAGGTGLMRVGSANFSTAAATAAPTTSGAITNGNGSYAGGRHHYPQAEPDPSLVARVRGLEEERAALLTACRRMQGKVDAASREAAATEELREAGQRKITSFAERAVAAERKAREVTVRLRTLESGQAALKAEREASARRCTVKHNQLLSAIDLQLSLRSQLEGLLEVVPPSRRSSPSAPASEPVRGLETLRQQEHGSVSATKSTTAAADAVAANAHAETNKKLTAEEASPTSLPKAQRRSRAEGSERSGAEGGSDAGEENSHKVLRSNGDGGGDDGGGGGHGDGMAAGRSNGGEGRDLDELQRRCSMLDVSLKASRREALEERRARDAAERTVRQQREALPRLKERVSELEACLAREQEAGKVASQAANGLEAELELRLDHLRKAESDLSEQTHANSRLKEELRVASARLGAASSARASLVDFCRQERTAVEQLAAEQVVRLEESAAARGEQHLAKGLELAKMAEDLGDKRAAGLMMEVDRLGKALFASRARLAGTEAVAQGLRRELERAAETIVDLTKSTIVSSPSPSGIVAPGAGAGSGGGQGGGVEGTASGEAVEAVLAEGGEGGGGAGGDASRERSGGLTEEEALMIRSPAASSAVTESGAGNSRSGDGSTIPVAVVERAAVKGGGGGRKGSIHKLALAAGGLTRRAASSKTTARPLSKPVASSGETPPTTAAAMREEADARGSSKMVNRSQSPRVARKPQKAAAYDVEL